MNGQLPYPWGAAPPDNTYAVYGCMADGSPGSCTGSTDILSVGSKSPKGDGKWGQADLAGSVCEWNLDWYVDPYGPSCTDCSTVDQGTASSRVIRGCGWFSDASALLSSARLNNPPTDHVNYIGVRCARTP